MNKPTLEFIKALFLNPKSLDALITGKIGVLRVSGDTNIDKIDKESLKKRILSDEFLSDFIETFEGKFTGSEISEIMSYYKSSSIQKFLNLYEELSTPIFSKIGSLIKSSD